MSDEPRQLLEAALEEYQLALEYGHNLMRDADVINIFLTDAEKSAENVESSFKALEIAYKYAESVRLEGGLMDGAKKVINERKAQEYAFR